MGVTPTSTILWTVTASTLFVAATRGEVTLRLVVDSVHVYTIISFLPETRSTMEEVAVWARRRLRPNDTRHQAAE